MKYSTIIVGMMLFMGESYFCSVWAREPNLDFYHIDRFAKNITTQGMYTKRFRLCDLHFGDFEIPLHMEFITDPASQGSLGPFWAMPLMESCLIPAGKNKIIFVSITGKRMLLDISPEGRNRQRENVLRYEQNGSYVEITLLAGDEKNKFRFEDNRLIQWQIISKKQSISLRFKRSKEAFTISSNTSSKPLLLLTRFNEEGEDGLHIKTAGHSFEFKFTDYDNVFDKSLGSVALLSSYSSQSTEQTHFIYSRFDMLPTELMEDAGQLALYKKFYSKKKDRRYASIVSEGPLNLNVTWNMDNGFSVLCGKNLCLINGNAKEWYKNSDLQLLRSSTHPDRWEKFGVNWSTGTRNYEASSGYSMKEKIILTPGKTYLKPRTGKTTLPNGTPFLYRISYGRDGNVTRNKITKTENK